MIASIDMELLKEQNQPFLRVQGCLFMIFQQTHRIDPQKIIISVKLLNKSLHLHFLPIIKNTLKHN